jgi:hypothetical protein
MLIVDIPENSRDSFYTGEVHVTTKDKICMPSHALRHGVEVASILRGIYSTDGINLDKPILFLYTDGGPDHRITNISVKLSLISLFIALDLDLLVAVRTAPSQSYVNPAERVCFNLFISAKVSIYKLTTGPRQSISGPEKGTNYKKEESVEGCS